jgi:hypothetical protein
MFQGIQEEVTKVLVRSDNNNSLLLKTNKRNKTPLVENLSKLEK